MTKTLLNLLAITILGTSLSALSAPDPQKLLVNSDRARGGGLPGIVWEIKLISKEDGQISDEQELIVQAVDDASVAETMRPARFKGSKLLQVGRNMWITRPGLSKPIPISPRQRLSGMASNGDIASTNYVADYNPELVGEDNVQGEKCYILELTAKHKRATYDRIRYWISIAREVGVKAEFYSLSGKLMKVANFDYNNNIKYAGQTFPFVSYMLIKDAFLDAETSLQYGEITVKPISTAEFDLGQMQ